MEKLIKLENGASLIGLKYPMRRALIEAGKIYTRHGKRLVITCGTNGEHSIGSYHYYGYAFDIRISFFGEEERLVVYNDLKAALNGDFDVVLKEDHIHVEFDVERFRKKCFEGLACKGWSELDY